MCRAMSQLYNEGKLASSIPQTPKKDMLQLLCRPQTQKKKHLKQQQKFKKSLWQWSHSQTRGNYCSTASLHTSNT